MERDWSNRSSLEKAMVVQTRDDGAEPSLCYSALNMQKTEMGEGKCQLPKTLLLGAAKEGSEKESRPGEGLTRRDLLVMGGQPDIFYLGPW